MFCICNIIHVVCVTFLPSGASTIQGAHVLVTAAVMLHIYSYCASIACSTLVFLHKCTLVNFLVLSTDDEEEEDSEEESGKDWSELEEEAKQGTLLVG